MGEKAVFLLMETAFLTNLCLGQEEVENISCRQIFVLSSDPSEVKSR